MSTSERFLIFGQAPLSLDDHIRINFQALLLSIAFVIVVVTVILFLSKRAGKRRYAAHQARLAAEGRLERNSALSDVANGPRTRFPVEPDSEPREERSIGAIFGDNYRPYGKDGGGE